MVNRMEPPLPTAALKDIGGAIVRRPFTLGTKVVLAGVKLSAERVLEIRGANRRALVSAGYIQIYPAGGEPASAAAEGGEAVADTAAVPPPRIAVHRGQGKYDVIEGVKLNEDPVTKEEADAIVNAGQAPSN